MPNRKGARNAYYFFVLEKLPELKRRGLAVTGVAEAIPHCSDDWAMLNEEQKEKYAEKARLWKAKKSELAKKPPSQLAVPLPTQTQNRVPVSNLTVPYRKCDQGEVPRGFRFHCQAAGEATHRIPISGFELASANHSVALSELYTFIQPRWGTWPPMYCKSDDQFRINWCLNHMAREAGRENHLELLNVEDLVVELYYQKLQKEPSKSWVRNTLDASMWDYSRNTRCQWHEENDVLFCALATCKKIAYCVSNSLANMYEIELTPSHLPLREKVSQSTVNPKMIVLDAGRFQKPRVECTGDDRYLSSLNQDQGATACTGVHPLGVKTMCETSTRHGRGIARFHESISKQTSS